MTDDFDPGNVTDGVSMNKAFIPSAKFKRKSEKNMKGQYGERYKTSYQSQSRGNSILR